MFAAESARSIADQKAVEKATAQRLADERFAAEQAATLEAHQKIRADIRFAEELSETEPVKRDAAL